MVGGGIITWLSVLSKRSLRDETPKNLCRIVFKLEHSRSMWLTVSGRLRRHSLSRHLSRFKQIYRSPVSVHGPQALSGMVAAIANESVPIQLAQCWFSGLAISNAKILFSNKINGQCEFFEPIKAPLGWTVSPGKPGTHPQYFGWGTSTGISPNIITYFRI